MSYSPLEDEFGLFGSFCDDDDDAAEQDYSIEEEFLTGEPQTVNFDAIEEILDETL